MKFFRLFYKESIPQQNVKINLDVIDYVISVCAITFIGEIIYFIFFYGIQLIFSFEISKDIESLCDLFGTIFTVMLVLSFLKNRNQRSYVSFGLIKRDFLKHYILGHIIGFIMFSSVIFLSFLCRIASFKILNFNPFLLFLYFIAFMIQGFEEELICRGYMMYGIGKTKSIFFAIMFNSIFFALLHLGNDGVTVFAIINIFLVGIIFSLIAVYFDNLWVASGIHSMWNFAQGCFYGILVSGISINTSIFQVEMNGPAILSGGAFGLEGSILTTIVLIISIIILCLKYEFGSDQR